MIRISQNEKEGVAKEYFQKGMVIFDEGGYDGQFYYYVAMDPFLEKGYFKNAYRQQRILYPLMARLFAFGKGNLLPYTLYIVNLTALAAGMYFFILILRRYSLHPAWSLFYGLSPPSIMTIQYDLPSPVSICLIIAAVYFYIRRNIFLATVFISFSFLVREDSIVVLLPLLVWDYQCNRRFKRIILLSSCLIPFFLWQLFVAVKLGDAPMATSAEVVSFIPFSGIIGYIKTIEFGDFKQIGRQFSTLVIFSYFAVLSVIIVKKLLNLRHLFYYVVAAYCLLTVFTVPSQWDNYNGLLRMFYGLFPFLVLSYCVEKDILIRKAVCFIGVLSFLTVIRILFISPIYPFRIW
ncbi:MAG: hypothetical protein HZB54_06320 [Deltaproteobacteria bacterium]|nr:hypothetical protein [Deltaproteobacteria bacterium]